MPASADRTPASVLRTVPSGMAGSQQRIAVEAVDITKAYGANLALNRVGFQVMAGKVNVILGENGAGKSTLMKVLAGEETPDAGRILCDGTEVRLRSPRDARQHGIGIIHQELSLFPALSVADNIFAGRERRRFGLIHGRRQLREADALLARIDERIDPQAIVGTLPVGKRQVVEIAKALADNVRVLIMDEPTSALSDAEVRSLFRVIGELAAQGVGIVYISHRMDEIFQIGDLLTVLRDGRCVASAAAADVDMPWIFENMLGARQQTAMREVQAARGDRPAAAPGEVPVLQAEGLTLADPGGNRLCLDDVSFALHPGEILGIYGLLGAGKTELAETIAGYRPDAMGFVSVGGRLVGHSIRRRMQAGIVLVPEDRQRDALVRTTSVADNVLLSCFGHVAKFGLISERRATRTVEDMIGLLSIRLRQRTAAGDVLEWRQSAEDRHRTCPADPSEGVDPGRTHTRHRCGSQGRGGADHAPVGRPGAGGTVFLIGVGRGARGVGPDSRSLAWQAPRDLRWPQHDGSRNCRCECLCRVICHVSLPRHTSPPAPCCPAERCNWVHRWVRGCARFWCWVFCC